MAAVPSQQYSLSTRASVGRRSAFLRAVSVGFRVFAEVRTLLARIARRFATFCVLPHQASGHGS